MNSPLPVGDEDKQAGGNLWRASCDLAFLSLRRLRKARDVMSWFLLRILMQELLRVQTVWCGACGELLRCGPHQRIAVRLEISFRKRVHKAPYSREVPDWDRASMGIQENDTW